MSVKNIPSGHESRWCDGSEPAINCVTCRVYREGRDTQRDTMFRCDHRRLISTVEDREDMTTVIQSRCLSCEATGQYMVARAVSERTPWQYVMNLMRQRMLWQSRGGQP
jgi:hypothetical protein